MKVIDQQNRMVLGEGRNHGMGFAFCKKVEEGVFETVQPISPCKDYLNDVIAAEVLKTSATACGLVYKPTGLFEIGKPAYMVVKIVDFQKPNPAYYSPEKDTERLSKTYPTILWMLNAIETKLGFKSMTTITKANDDHYLFEVNYEWITSTYMISLYTLIIRMGQCALPMVTPLDFLYNIPVLDGALWQSAQKKFEHILNTKELPVQKFAGNPGNYHSTGIVSWQIPIAPVKAQPKAAPADIEF